MWTGHTDQLVIHTKHQPLPLRYWAHLPYAVINGHRVPLRWGENRLPCPPGIHHISIHRGFPGIFGSNSIFSTPPATITVDNRNAPAPPIYWAHSYGKLTPDAIGHQPVRTRDEPLVILGALCMLAIAAVLVGLHVMDAVAGPGASGQAGSHG